MNIFGDWFLCLIFLCKVASTSRRNSSISQDYLVKCCPSDNVLSVSQKSAVCVSHNRGSLGQEQRLQLEFEGHLIVYPKENDYFHQSHKPLTHRCEYAPRVFTNDKGVWFKVDELSGRLALGLDYFIQAAWIPVSPEKDSYCLDFTEDDEEHKSSEIKSLESFPTLLLCSLDDEILEEFLFHRYLYGVSSIVTCLPIFITLIIWTFLGIHKNRRKWVLISYFLSYALACLVHGIQILLYTNSSEHESSEASLGCKLFYHLLLYLACVFGTACMFVSLDIFFCFKNMTSTLGMPYPSVMKSILIFLGTWILPLIVYVVGELLRDFLDPSPPDFAWRRCMTRNFNLLQAIQMFQFIFKMGVYLSTSVFIYRHKKSTEFATVKMTKDFNDSVTLYLKLFVTTGMPFSFLALDYVFAERNPMAYHWFLLRFPHAFIGFYIFFVFGISTDIRKKLNSYLQSRRGSTVSGKTLSDYGI